MNKRTEELLKWDREHVFHSLGTGKQNMGIVFESAEGVKIKDTEGKEYIDLASQLVNVNLNHRYQPVLDAAKAQMDKLSFASLLRGFSNAPAIELAQKLGQIVPQGLDHFMWTMTGSDANDCAFRFVDLYWRAKGRPKKTKIISLFNSYHGTSRAVANASMVFGGMINEAGRAPGHVHIPNYYCTLCPFDKEYPGCDMFCAKFLEYTIQNEGPESVGAFLVEPVQGAGGFVSPPAEYWPKIREICSKYEVLLIADEVMTGFCRTGKMFAVEHWNIIPDMMTMSKGIVGGYLPFGAVAVSAEITDALDGQFLPLGSTESGNPVCCVVASKCIDVYLEEKVADHAAAIGQHVRERFENEFLPLPHVLDISGLGLMMSLGVTKDKKSKALPGPETTMEITRRGFEKGLYLRIMGGRICYGPPLLISREEADESLDILYTILSELKLS